MKTNPFSDSFWFLLGQTGENQGAGPIYGWILTLLFPALLAASLWIARRNWTSDPNQRSPHHLAIWAMRVLIGCMWFQGSLWKLPLPVAGGLKYWLEQEVEHAAFGWHGWLIQNVVLPGQFILGTPVYLTELMLGILFILGLWVRPAAVVGMLFTLQLWLGLYKHPGEWPWEYIFLIFVQGFFFLDSAGRSLGLDATLARTPCGPLKGDGPVARLYRWLA